MAQEKNTPNLPVQSGQVQLDEPPKDRRKKNLTQKKTYSLRNLAKKYPFAIYGGFWLILLVAVLIFCLKVVPTFGRTAGLAVGSWHGVAEGIAAGAESGKNAGLSARDTEAEIVTKMTECGNLEVMIVDLQLTDLYKEGKNYAALYGLKGEGIFTVNLTQAKAAYNGEQNIVTITIPEPEITLYLDDDTLAVLAEYKTEFFNGNTEDGYKGYLNSREQFERKATEEMTKMMPDIKPQAEKQIELLAQSVCGSTASVVVQYTDGEE